ncbi:MAG: IS66 family insertion sequence element accessory protein TnpB [Turicibacter sp.]|nr:IS66 family insertion sequence element accessory protein TnpB [Turicibacter sp.]
MLVNFSNVQNIFIVCGHTDMRCGIDGLAGIITDKYNLDFVYSILIINRDAFEKLTSLL